MSGESVPPPVFVLSAPALPAATLAAALGRNPEAFGLPEITLPLAATTDAYLRELSGIRVIQSHGLLRAISQLYAGEQTVHAVEMARRWIDSRAWMTTPMVFQEIAARLSPYRLVSPVGSLLFDGTAMKRLRATFPGASYVVIRAHPRVYGELALGQDAGRVAIELSGSLDETFEPPLPDPQTLWLQSEAELARHVEDLPADRLMILRAETLVRDPEATLKGLARSLGMPSGKAALSAMMQPEASLFAGPGPIGAHSDGMILSFAALAQDFPDPEDEQLDGPLPWRPDGAGFSDEVRDAALDLGMS